MLSSEYGLALIILQKQNMSLSYDYQSKLITSVISLLFDVMEWKLFLWDRIELMIWRNSGVVDFELNSLINLINSFRRMGRM